jgi:DNA processing protein
MTPQLSPLLADDRCARAAWSRLAEPADARALALIKTHGAVTALAMAIEGAGDIVDTFRLRAERLDVERDLAVADRVGARVVCPGDDEWPTGVDDLDAPPICLWVRGPADLPALARRSVAVVGARSCTSYGDLVASDLAAGIADRGFTVVSGAAFGIDAAAHRGALAVDGVTVAVLAGGVDRPYPVAHQSLIRRIVETGAVISEVAPGSAPTRPRFLLRNRLIATMTTGTIVVEAGLRSGSLNTARTAAEHNRPVGVVPGPVTSMVSAGCHQARRDGFAEIVTDVAEVIELVGVIGDDAAPRRSAPEQRVDGLDPADATALAAVPIRKAASVESIAVAAGLAPTAMVGSLARLELLDLVVREGDGWRKRPPERAAQQPGVPVLGTRRRPGTR